jgi:two-component system NtrC family sensor kinase
MEPAILSSLPLWTINLALAGLVYYREPRRASHATFAVYVLMLVGWSFCVKMVDLHAAHPAGIMWGRMAFAAGSLAGMSFVAFCQTFPDRHRFCINRTAWRLILLGILVSGLTMTPLILRAVDTSESAQMRTHYGALYPIYGVYLLASLGYGIKTLLDKWRAARGRHRLQMQYMLLGLFLTIAGGLTTNLLIPTLFHTSRLSRYGPYFTLCYVGLTAHAIIRHRLMDIRLVIRRGVTYGLSVGMTGGLMWALLSGLRAVPTLELSTMSLALLMGLVGMVVFHPARTVIQQLMDRYVYRGTYDYRQAIRDMSQVLASLLRMTPLCDYLSRFLHTTLQVERVAVYLCDPQMRLERMAVQDVRGEIEEEPSPSDLEAPSLMTLTGRAAVPVVRDELRSLGAPSDVACLAVEFERLGGEVVIPLRVEGEVTAFITVGAKLSGDPFYQHDLEFLTTIGHQASIALRRAQLYEEVMWIKEYNESILRHMESGVVVVTHEGMVTVVNEAAGRMLEVKPGDVIGGRATEVLPQPLDDALAHTLTGSKVYTNHEAALKLASGRVLPVVLSTSVLHWENGEPGGAILVCNDLSRLKELEEDKRRTERLAAIGMFVSGIAHEIRNPLVVIKTFAELLPEQFDDPEFRQTFTKVALQEVGRIDNLVQRLRGLAVSSGPELHPVQITEVLDETLEFLVGTFTKQQIEVSCHYASNLPCIYGDWDQLKQVFLNLFLNSVDAMEGGGTLQISVEHEFSQKRQQSQLVIRITDSGSGIPEASLQKIFEPFVSSKDTGTGLGLAICQGIVEYHRGTITAHNNDETGATFTVTLPVVHGELHA